MAKKKRKPSKKKSKRRKVPAHFKPTVRQNEVVAKEESVKEEPPPPPVAPIELEAPMDDYDEEEEEEDEEEEEMGYDSRFSFYSHRAIPKEDWFEGRDLNDEWNLGEALENFIFWLEDKKFLTWEAVIRQEKDLPLSRRQKKALRNLGVFDSNEYEPIWYIDEMPRPQQTWYQIARELAPRLLQKEPIVTSEIPTELMCDGWPNLADAIEKHARHLSLPKGVKTPFDIFPPDLFHRLELQACFDILRGLGQEKELNLADQTWRVPDFVDRLHESKASVAYLDLTLEKLLTKVIMPPHDERLFVRRMVEELNLTSLQEPLANKL